MKPRVKKRGDMERRYARWGWFFIAPFAAGAALILIEVVFMSLQFSFSELEMTSSRYVLHFTSFENYFYALREHKSFLRTMITSTGSFLLQVPVIVFFSLFIATLLNQKMWGRGMFRAIFFLPVIISTGVILQADSSNMILSSMENLSGISSGAYSSGSGINLADVESMLSGMYIGTDIINFVLTLVDNIYDVVNRSGVQIILLLAGLQSISPGIYEAAEIEGVSGWEAFWKITLPMISPIMLVITIYTVVDGLTRADNPIMKIISDTAFVNLNYGASSAMAWIYFALIALVLVVISRVLMRHMFYQEK